MIVMGCPPLLPIHRAGRQNAFPLLRHHITPRKSQKTRISFTEKHDLSLFFPVCYDLFNTEETAEDAAGGLPPM
jgi:hypothetical protein